MEDRPHTEVVAKKRSKLEDYLRENVEFLNFKRDNYFWNNLKLSSDIKIKDFVAKDPLVPIVGKKEEKELGKFLNYKTAIIQAYRNKRHKKLVILSLEYELLKKKGFKSHIEDRERELIKDGLNWEKATETILEEIVQKERYNRKQFIEEEILGHWPQIFFKVKIDWKRISERIRDELPTPPILYFEGPVGSGKSFLQRQLAESYKKLTEELGVECFDYMAIRNPANNNEAEIIRLPAFDGKELIRYDEEQKERKENRKKAIRYSLFGGLGGIALYGAITIGKRLVSIPWGLGIGVNPLLDLWMWATDGNNLKIMTLILFGGMGLKGLSIFKKIADRGKDTRPEALALATDIAPIYVGNMDDKEIGLANLIGLYNRRSEEPPQNGFERKPGILMADGKVLIFEQIGEQSEDVQSWLGQVIQEREIDIANNGAFSRDFFAAIYLGSNPHKKKDIITPIRDRIKLGKSCYVTNEIERTIDTERELFCFLEHYRTKSEKKIPPMDKSAMEEAKNVSIILSEGKDTLIINRRYLSVLDNAFGLALKESAGLITKEHIKEALDITKSDNEKLFEGMRLEPYYKLFPIKISGSESGRVNFIPLITDEKLISDTDNPTIRKEMAEEDGLGYISNVRAYYHNKPGLEIIRDICWDKNVIENYKTRLESL
ncbi:hypothetical protein HYX19_00260, partial [Candidatus Woesearchaeota archaeon]|nr:hypothetical protein [Candidatus Woesearchaeota archaeon]